MKSSEWFKVLQAEVEKRFNPEEVDGFEDSASSIKLGILSDLYDDEPVGIERSKELAYDKLAYMYSTESSWN